MRKRQANESRPEAVLAAGVAPREAWSWAMFDFANSGYTTVVITAIFNAYFVKVIAGNAPWATLVWTLALGVSYLLVLITAPLIGALADVHAAKKPLLAVTTAGCVACTALLGLAGPGELWLAIVFLVLSNFFFGTGEDLIAAFLPELGNRGGLGRLSAWGWSLGYLGGLLTLALCLAYVTSAQARDAPASHFVPVTLWITAGLFLLASLPTFLWLRERATPQPGNWREAAAGALHRLADTWQHAQRYRDLVRFLVCIVFYQAGVQTVVALAAVYAEQALGFTTRDTIALILAVNVAAAAGAYGFGQVQDRMGHRATLMMTLIGWIATVVLAWWATTAEIFWIAATLAGICLGSSQSAGRALVGYLSPPDRVGEFFGLWGVAMKLAAILGPVTYGMVVWISAGEHRTAILATGAFFVIGLALLARIDVARGRSAIDAPGRDAPL